MKATTEQQAVIDTKAGQVLVTACPGSGKTATLVERTKALPAEQKKLVLAFNKKAAEEFNSRLGRVPNSDVRTFHSLCFREVTSHPFQYGFTGKPALNSESLYKQLLRATDRTDIRGGWEASPWDEDLFKEAANRMYDEDVKAMMREHKPLLNDREIGLLHNERLLAEPKRATEIQAEIDAAMIQKKVFETCKAILLYREWLVRNGFTTFSEMVRLVAENRHALGFAAEHIMVDEFQDVDRFQYDIVASLARNAGVKSFACVGDPKQRIYEWRGALQDAFRKFQEDFPGAIVLPMTMNFRSTPEIVSHAETICEGGMKANRDSIPGSVKLIADILPVVKILAADSEDLSNIAILARYNRVCAQIQLQLAKDGIPVFLMGKGDFWSATHVKLAKLAWQMEAKPEDLFNNRDWQRMLCQKRFQDNAELVEEVQGDAEWLMSLSEADMKLLENTIQREDIGMRISTIHKTKGLEWDTVLIAGVDQKLRSDTFVWYVAATRARSLLLLEDKTCAKEAKQ